MATIEQNVNQAISDFDDIKGAIINKGVAVPSGTHTYEFADKIAQISSSVMLPVQKWDRKGSYWNKIGTNIFAIAQPNGTPGAYIDGVYKSFTNNLIEGQGTSLTLISGYQSDNLTCELSFNVSTKIKLELSLGTGIENYYRVTVWAEYKEENNTYYEPQTEYWSLMTDWDLIGSDFTNNKGILTRQDPMGFSILGDDTPITVNTIYTVTSLVVRCGWASGEYPESQKAYKTFTKPTKLKFINYYDMKTSSNYLYVLAVSDSVLPESITLNVSDTISSGGTIPLAFSVTPSNALNYPYYWSSSYLDIVISNNTLTVPSHYSVGDTISVYLNCCGITASKTITVTQGVIVPTSVTISPTNPTISVDQTQQFTASVLPSDAVDKSITWSSSNIGVASINSSGLATALTSGNTNITATTVNNITATTVLTVSGSEPEPSGDYTLFDGFTHIGTAWEKQSAGVYYANNTILYCDIGYYIISQGGLQTSLQSSYSEFNTDYLCIFYGPSPGSGYPGNDTFLIYEGDPIDFKLKKTDESHIEILAKTSSPGPTPSEDWIPADNSFVIGGNFEYKGDGIYESPIDIRDYSLNGGSNVSIPTEETVLENVNTLRFNNVMQAAAKYIELGFDNFKVKFKYIDPSENLILSNPGVQVWYQGTEHTSSSSSSSWTPCENFDCFGSYWSDMGGGKLNYGYIPYFAYAYANDISSSSTTLSRQIINLLENVDTFRLCMSSYNPLDSALYNQLEGTASVIIIPDMPGGQFECYYNYSPMPSGYSSLSTNAISNSEWNYSGLGLWSIPPTYGATKYQADGGEMITLTEDTEITASNLMIYSGGDYGFNSNKLSYSGAEKTFKIIKITDYACQILYET